MNIDEKCDSACNNGDCGWDDLKCGCAPECNYEDLKTCKPECMNIDCNWGAVPGYPACEDQLTRTANKYYQIDQSALFKYMPSTPFNITNICQGWMCDWVTWQSTYLKCPSDGSCRAGDCLPSLVSCKTSPTCLAMFSIGGGKNGYCYECVPPYLNTYGVCALQCLFGLRPHPLAPEICAVFEDGTSESDPKLLFVVANYTGESDGSWERPFADLSEALSNVKTRYSKVYLVGDSHLFEPNFYSVFVLVITAGNTILVSPGPQLKLTIASWDCETAYAQGHDCTRPTLWLDGENPFALSSPFTHLDRLFCHNPMEAGSLELLNLRFVGFHTDAQFSDPPSFIILNSQFLILTNVSFSNLPELDAVIKFDNNQTMTLNNVDFLNMTNSLHLVKGSSSSFTCKDKISGLDNTQHSNLTIRGGKVANFSIMPRFDNDVLRMIRADEISTVLIEKVIFENITLTSTDSRLLYFHVYQSVEIRNCIFRFNVMNPGQLIRIEPSNYDPLLQYNNSFAPKNTTNCLIKDCSFSNNRALAGSDIVVFYTVIQQNVVIENCTFENEYISPGSVISMASDSFVDITRINGASTYFTTSKGTMERRNFPPNYFKLADVIIANCLAIGNALVYGKNIAYLDISNITIRNFDDVLSFTAVRVESSYGVSFGDMSLRGWEIAQDCYFIDIRNSSNINIRNSDFTNNRGNGPLIFIESIGKAVVTEVIVKNCSNKLWSSRGVFHFTGVNANLTVNKSRFVENSAFAAGAIFIDEVGFASLINSTFESNEAYQGQGGAVLIWPTSHQRSGFSTLSCDFIRNKAKTEGGALYFKYSLDKPTFLSISKSIFTSNLASKGSALYIHSQLEGRISGSRFSDHSESSEGVLALHFSYGTLEIADSIIESNWYPSGVVITAAHGTDTGPIAQLIFTSVVFRNNTGTSIVRIPAARRDSHLAVSDSVFLENSGVCLNLETTLLFISNSSFRDNMAVSGTVFQLFASTADISISNFTRNIAKESAGVGVVYGYSSFSCSECLFANNSAELEVGVLNIKQQTEFLLVNSIFEGNSAGKDASVLFLQVNNVNSLLKGCRFVNNTAGGDGTITLFTSSLSIVNSTLERNTAAKSTPGIYVVVSKVSMQYCTFRNQRGTLGSMLYLSTLSTATLNFSEFESGLTLTTGGIYVESSFLFVYNSHFHNLSASAGSILHAFGNSEVTVVNSFASSQSNSLGGAVFCEISNCYIDGFEISDYTDSAVIGSRSKIIVANSEFTSKCHTGGRGIEGVGAKCVDCDMFVISNSTFRELQGSRGSAIYIPSRKDNSEEYRIEDCYFEENHGSEIGAVLVSDILITIRNNEFIGNTVGDSEFSGRGAAVVVTCKPSSKCEFVLIDNIFKENRARLKGGAISWEDIPPIFINNTFTDNDAPYGPDIASFPFRIVTSNVFLTAVAPGLPCKDRLDFTLLDHYNQTVSVDNKTEVMLTFVPGESTQVYGNSILKAKNGKYVFDNFIISATPGATTIIQAELLRGSSIVYLNVSMRLCEPGETEDNGRCLLCEAGTVSLDPSQPCQDCPEQAICLGNYTMYPRTGYWRTSPYTKKFFECPNPEACLGNVSLTGRCAEGYEGNMCETCSADFFRASKVYCVKCPNIAEAAAQTSGLVVGIIILMLIFVKMNISSAHKEKALHSIYLKVLMNYVQLVMLMGSFNLSWPSLAKQLLDVHDSVGAFSEHLITINCLKEGSSETDFFYTKIVTVAFVPAILFGASSLLWALIALVKWSPSKLKNELVCSAVVLFFLVHPSVLRVMFGVFNCQEILTGEYWMSPLHIRCWTDEHWKYSLAVALPCIIVWGFGVPAIVLLVLVLNRKKLHITEWKIRLGYLYSSYSPTKYYWEFVLIYRKLVVICIAVFLPSISATLQALIALAVLLAAQLLHSHHNPFTSETLNSLENRSLFVAIATMFCGLYFLEAKLSAGLEVVFVVIIFAVNADFMQFWLRKAARPLTLFVFAKLKRFMPQFTAKFNPTAAVSPSAYQRSMTALSKFIYLKKLAIQYRLQRISSDWD